jgi:hypothetical protein
MAADLAGSAAHERRLEKKEDGERVEEEGLT